MNLSDHNEEIPETLRSMLDKNPFQVAENYFTQLQDKTWAKIEKLPLDELGLLPMNHFQLPENYFEDSQELFISSLNAELNKKESGFNIPSGYFDQLQDTVVQKITRTNEKGILTNWYRQHYKWISIAASIILLWSVFVLRTSTSNTFQTLNITEIDDETLINFIALQEADIHDLSDEIDESSFPEINLINDDLDEESVNELINIYQ